MSKVKKFVKEHWKGITAGTLAVGVGGALYWVFKDYGKAKSVFEEINIPAIGKVETVASKCVEGAHPGSVILGATDVAAADLGVVGEIVSKIDGFDPNKSQIDLIIGFKDRVE